MASISGCEVGSEQTTITMADSFEEKQIEPVPATAFSALILSP